MKACKCESVNLEVVIRVDDLTPDPGGDKYVAISSVCVAGDWVLVAKLASGEFVVWKA